MGHQHDPVIGVLLQPRHLLRPLHHRIAGRELHIQEKVVLAVGGLQFEGAVLDGGILVRIESELADRRRVERVAADREIFVQVRAPRAAAGIGVVVVAGGDQIGHAAVQHVERIGHALPLAHRGQVA